MMKQKDTNVYDYMCLFLVTDCFKGGMWETLNSMSVTHNMNNELSSLKNILLQSQQPSPVKVYQRHVRKFKEWCQKLELNSLPAAEEHYYYF